jgi:putative ABC transport system permease protein
VNTLWQDLRYAARLLVKKPGFTALIVLTLGIGIGANTTIFSAAQAIFLRSLPYGEAERLLYLSSSFPGNTRGGDNFSYADFADLAQRNRLLEKVAAYQDWVAVALTGIDEPVRLTANFVTGSYFEMLGASAALGRTFTVEEQRVPATESVVILSHSCWQRQFGGDPNIVGRRIALNQTPATVIGVMREGFRDFEETWRPEVDAWLPMGMSQGLLGNQLAQRSFRLFYGVAKPRAGVTLEQARTEIEAISHQLAAENPATDRGYSFHLAPLRDHFVGNFYNPMRLLLIGSGFVLLIGCANVAGLLLARVAGRRREMAVRAAVGATRGRLMQQLLVESTLVSLLAGVAGILIAAWLAPWLRLCRISSRRCRPHGINSALDPDWFYLRARARLGERED